MMRKRGAVIFAFLAVLGACRRPADPPTAPARALAFQGDSLPPPAAQGTPAAGGELRVAMEAEPPSLNYQLDPLDAWAKKIGELVFESLARPHPETFEHEPRLAERWEVSPDGRTFTFFLRRDVRWHDGRPFSADDVVFTFDKLRDPRAKTVAMRSFLEPLASCTKLDSHTVRFVFARPYWLALDVAAEILIYPRHVYAGGDFNTHPANRAPVGTGRYRFARWDTGDRIVLERNDDYFGDKARLERVVFKYVPDPTARVQMLRRGEVDVVERVSPEVWARVTADPAIAAGHRRLRHVPSSLQWVGWNQARPLFADKRVRRALTMLIDRRDIVDNLRLGLDRVAASWFYPGARDYDPTLTPLPYDPAAARRLLEEAGWRDGDGDGVRERNGERASFTFIYPAGNPFYEQLAGLMRAELARAGIDVRTSRTEWAVFMERLRRHDFDACSLLWQMDARHDPYQIWHSSAVYGGSNFIGFRSPEVDGLLERARAELDPTRRAALYRRLSAVLHEEQPYTMLFNRYNLSLVSKGFGGVRSSPYGIVRYGEMYRVAPAGGAPP